MLGERDPTQLRLTYTMQRQAGNGERARIVGVLEGAVLQVG